jgi:hypothetical protein
MNNKIYAPNIHFFAFHLQESSIIKVYDRKSIVDKDWLWRTCDEIILNIFPDKNFKFKTYLDFKKQPNNPYVILSDINSLKNLPKPKDNNFYISGAIPIEDTVTLNNLSVRIQGFALPIKIYNNYGLWLNLGCPKQENSRITNQVDISLLRNLNPNNILLSADKKGFSGQLILITGWLLGADIRKSSQQLQEYADECLRAFLPDNSPMLPLNRVGELFGSPIFQYGLDKDLPSSGNIIVCFFRGNKAHNKFYYSKDQILYLFFYRAQIIKSFQDAIKLLKLLRNLDQYIIKDIKNLQKLGKNRTLSQAELDEFQFQLTRLPIQIQSYESLKAKINISKNTIDDKVDKYKITLEKIRSKFQDEDMSFLETITNQTWPYYQEQIEANLIYLEHGSKLITNAIASIRGQLAIEQTEIANKRIENQEFSDLNLQLTIFAVGSGLSVGGIVSQIIADGSNHPPIIKDHFSQYSYYITATIYSFLVGVIFGLIFWVILHGVFWLTQRISAYRTRRILNNNKKKKA